ncbi:MAG: hypothetical protein K2L45_09505 [Muribaculaceae bacterium]|nr:hypothetical protein [Muribaculaceae bacterium]
MKRLYLLILIAVLTTGIAASQNANRSGFFLELGFGGLVGDTPRYSFSIAENVLSYRCLAGAAGDFGFGGRFRMGNHWAYELKAEVQLPLKNPINSMIGRVLPVGFRYTSVEIVRNYSLYAHLNIGGAITVNRGIIDTECILLPNIGETKLGYFAGAEGYGVAYSIGVGANVTTHLYFESSFNGQAIFRSYGKNGLGTNNYGIVGLFVGYRF